MEQNRTGPRDRAKRACRENTEGMSYIVRGWERAILKMSVQSGISSFQNYFQNFVDRSFAV